MIAQQINVAPGIGVAARSPTCPDARIHEAARYGSEPLDILIIPAPTSSPRPSPTESQ